MGPNASWDYICKMPRLSDEYLSAPSRGKNGNEMLANADESTWYAAKLGVQLPRPGNRVDSHHSCRHHGM